MIVFTFPELATLNEIVGGRFDALLELASNENIPNRTALLADIEILRPIVEKIRAAL